MNPIISVVDETGWNEEFPNCLTLWPRSREKKVSCDCSPVQNVSVAERSLGLLAFGRRVVHGCVCETKTVKLAPLSTSVK